MKPSKLYEALHALIGERMPLHIRGACGVGKSEISRRLNIGRTSVRRILDRRTQARTAPP
jgi:hypothetical protein